MTAMSMEPTMEAGQADMHTLETRITTLDDKLDKVNENLLKLQGQMMPRAEIEAADGRRVSLERFEGETAGIRDRLSKLEGGPQKALAWIGAGVGCLSAVFTALGVTAAIVIAIVPHLK